MSYYYAPTAGLMNNAVAPPQPPQPQQQQPQQPPPAFPGGYYYSSYPPQEQQRPPQQMHFQPQPSYPSMAAADPASIAAMHHHAAMQMHHLQQQQQQQLAPAPTWYLPHPYVSAPPPPPPQAQAAFAGYPAYPVQYGSGAPPPPMMYAAPPAPPSLAGLPTWFGMQPGLPPPPMAYAARPNYLPQAPFMTPAYACSTPPPPPPANEAAAAYAAAAHAAACAAAYAAHAMPQPSALAPPQPQELQQQPQQAPAQRDAKPSRDRSDSKKDSPTRPAQNHPAEVRGQYGGGGLSCAALPWQPRGSDALVVAHASRHTADIKAPQDPCHLVVKFLPAEISDAALAGLFAPFGTVVDARIIRDRVSGHSKGYGFVDFADEAHGAAALLQLHGHSLGGKRPIRVACAARERNVPVVPTAAVATQEGPTDSAVDEARLTNVHLSPMLMLQPDGILRQGTLVEETTQCEKPASVYSIASAQHSPMTDDDDDHCAEALIAEAVHSGRRQQA